MQLRPALTCHSICRGCLFIMNLSLLKCMKNTVQGQILRWSKPAKLDSHFIGAEDLAQRACLQKRYIYSHTFWITVKILLWIWHSFTTSFVWFTLEFEFILLELSGDHSISKEQKKNGLLIIHKWGTLYMAKEMSYQQRVIVGNFSVLNSFLFTTLSIFGSFLSYLNEKKKEII